MTDKQKLQSLFEAALKDTSVPSAPSFKRAFPTSSLEAVPVPAAVAPARPLQPVTPVVPAAPAAVLPAESPEPAGPPTMAAVLDDVASTELAGLLDEQNHRVKRKRKVEALVTAAVLFGITGGGTIWFVQSPQRVQAFQEALRDIRSVGDVKGLVAKYQASLDRVSARGKQVEEATLAMGVKPTAADQKDPFMDAEMQQMMGGEGNGKTVGQRNNALKKSFGDMAEKNGGVPKPTTAVKANDSLGLNP